MIKAVLIASTIALYILAFSYFYPLYYKEREKEGSVSPLAIKRAVTKMGPGRDYSLKEGRLKVFVEGKWLLLRY